MRFLSLFWILALSWSAGAETVHRATCIRPKGKPHAPVSAIYLHGWFNANSSVTDGFYVELEKSNRAQLQDLADKMGISIAVPLAPNRVSLKAGVMRAWSPSQTPGTAARALKSIEKESESVCGQPLAAEKTLIGFSDGGYQAREMALQCAAKTPQYKNVIMMGARARDGSKKGRDNCAPLIAIRGTEDDSTAKCLSKVRGKCIRSVPFEIEAEQMARSIGGNTEIFPPYEGGHILAPNKFLANFIVPTTTNIVTTTAPPPTTVLTSDKDKAPVTTGGHAEFLDDFPPATR